MFLCFGFSRKFMSSCILSCMSQFNATLKWSLDFFLRMKCMYQHITKTFSVITKSSKGQIYCIKQKSAYTTRKWCIVEFVWHTFQLCGNKQMFYVQLHVVQKMCSYPRSKRWWSYTTKDWWKHRKTQLKIQNESWLTGSQACIKSAQPSNFQSYKTWMKHKHYTCRNINCKWVNKGFSKHKCSDGRKSVTNFKWKAVEMATYTNAPCNEEMCTT